MSPVTNRGFAFTNVVANRALIPVLKSRAGRRLSRRLAVVEYLGIRSRRRHRLVTQFVTDGRTVRIRVGMAERKTWWRNFRAPHRLRLRLAGEDHDATAHVMRDGDGVCVVAELEPHVGTSDSGWLEGPVQATAAGFSAGLHLGSGKGVRV